VDGTELALVIGAVGAFVVTVGGFAVKSYIDVKTALALLNKKQDDAAVKQEENSKALDGKLTELMTAKVEVAKLSAEKNLTEKLTTLEAAKQAGRIEGAAAVVAPVNSLALESTLQKAVDKLPEKEPS
jgi:hypothetical protein